MQLTVEVKTSAQITSFTCQGKITKGDETNYLFDLLTRQDDRNIVLDLQQIREFDYSGLLTLVVCQEYLSSQRRRLALRLPSPLPATNPDLQENIEHPSQSRVAQSNFASSIVHGLRRAASVAVLYFRVPGLLHRLSS